MSTLPLLYSCTKTNSRRLSRSCIHLHFVSKWSVKEERRRLSLRPPGDRDDEQVPERRDNVYVMPFGNAPYWDQLGVIYGYGLASSRRFCLAEWCARLCFFKSTNVCSYLDQHALKFTFQYVDLHDNEHICSVIQNDINSVLYHFLRGDTPTVRNCTCVMGMRNNWS